MQLKAGQSKAKQNKQEHRHTQGNAHIRKQKIRSELGQPGSACTLQQQLMGRHTASGHNATQSMKPWQGVISMKPPHGDRSGLVRPEDFAKLPLHEVLVSVLLRARAHSAVKVLEAGAVSVWDVVRLPIWIFMCDPVTRKQPILIEQKLSRASWALPSVQPASSQRRNAYFRLAATPALPLGRSSAACCVIALPCLICTRPRSTKDWLKLSSTFQT